MNLTDLQVELRSIEEHLENLHHEIDKMKPKSEDEKKTDFRTIDKLASKNKIVNNVICKMPDEKKKHFFKGLSYLLLSAENNIYAKLLYLSRVSLGSGLNWKSEELYKSGLLVEDVDDIVYGMEEYRRTFLVEAFVISCINGSVNEKTLSIIADLAKLFGCDQEELRMIAQVAKCRLTNDMDKLLEMPVPTKNRWMNQFWDYIPYEWIEKNRIECGELCTKKYYGTLKKNNVVTRRLLGEIEHASKEEKSSSTCVIKNRCQAGSIVRAGETICTYIEKSTIKMEGFGNNYLRINLSELDGKEEKIIEKELKAPRDGLVFFINDNRSSESIDKKEEYVVVYVVSFFDDYNDFTKWFQKEHKGV